MRIAIFGVGAMGCLFGARLSPRADVTLIGRWPEQLDALHRARLRIIHPNRREEYADLHATDDVAGVGPVDVALILTKAARTRAVAEMAAGILAPEGIAVTLQNGLGNQEIIARHVGPSRALIGVTMEGAAVQKPGVLRYAGGGETYLARQNGGSALLDELAALLNQGRLPTEVVDDVSAMLWGKLAINAAVNPLTALLRVPNGALLESPRARYVMHEVALEVAAVAEANGIRLPFNDPPRRVEEVVEQTAGNRSSMLQDVLRGVPTEIETICGAVMRSGRTLGVPVPANTLLYRLVKALEETTDARL